MTERTKRLAAVVAGVLGADAMVHLYWATGSVWPAADEASLAEAVLGKDDVSFGPEVTLPLALLLLSAASLVWARANVGRSPLVQAGTMAVAGGLSLRAAAGVVWALGIGVDAGSPFSWLNVVVYTPLCAVLAWATLQVAREPGGARLPA